MERSAPWLREGIRVDSGAASSVTHFYHCPRQSHDSLEGCLNNKQKWERCIPTGEPWRVEVGRERERSGGGRGGRGRGRKRKRKRVG
jgi:hypothetical protein